MYVLLLPCCTVIAAAGYHINSINSKSQKQPITGYKVTSKSLSGLTPLTGGENHYRHYTNDNSSMLTLSNPDNDFIYGYIPGISFCIVDKRSVT